MRSSYECTFNGEIVGAVELKRIGLYYQLQCQCQLSGSDIYRLYVSTSMGEQKIGVCVPREGLFCCDTRIPVSRLGEEGSVRFYLRGSEEHGAIQFYPLDSNRVVELLPSLPYTFFAIKDGVRGLAVKQKESETQDNGLNP